jgi:hypothetical protein
MFSDLHHYPRAAYRPDNARLVPTTVPTDYAANLAERSNTAAVTVGPRAEADRAVSGKHRFRFYKRPDVGPVDIIAATV